MKNYKIASGMFNVSTSILTRKRNELTKDIEKYISRINDKISNMIDKEIVFEICNNPILYSALNSGLFFSEELQMSLFKHETLNYDDFYILNKTIYKDINDITNYLVKKFPTLGFEIHPYAKKNEIEFYTRKYIKNFLIENRSNFVLKGVTTI